MGKALGNIVTALVGGGVGTGIALYADRAAEAAYKVRPALHDVGLWDAVMSEHGPAWIMHNAPEVCYPVYVAMGILTALGLRAVLKK